MIEFFAEIGKYILIILFGLIFILLAIAGLFSNSFYQNNDEDEKEEN